MRRLNIVLTLRIVLASLAALSLLVLLVVRWRTPLAPPALDPRLVLTVTAVPTVAPLSSLPSTSAALTTPTRPAATQSSLHTVDDALRAIVQIRTPFAIGTGFVWTAEATRTILVTAAHVVANAVTVTLIAPDGTSDSARVLRLDTHRDVAVLEAPAVAGIAALPRGESRTLPLGSELLALGFALGDELLGDPTVTRGVLSGRRTFDGVQYVQTDTALNPGASGGPLLNDQGAVVGMAVGVVPWAGDIPAQGLNFAVAIEEVALVVLGVS
ncbi:MAG: S1C family serine protease [Thermomicrobium sp.]